MFFCLMCVASDGSLNVVSDAVAARSVVESFLKITSVGRAVERVHDKQ